VENRSHREMWCDGIYKDFPELPIQILAMWSRKRVLHLRSRAKGILHFLAGYFSSWFLLPKLLFPILHCLLLYIEWNLKTTVYIWNFLPFSRQRFDSVPVPTCLAFKISNNSNSRPTFSLASQLVKRLHDVDILFPIENTHTACCLAT